MILDLFSFLGFVLSLSANLGRDQEAGLGSVFFLCCHRSTWSLFYLGIACP